MQVTTTARKSHLARNLVVLVLVVLLVGAAAAAYSYTQLSGQIMNVSYSGLVWAQPSPSVLVQLVADGLTGDWIGVALTLVTGINLDAQLSIKNGGIVPVSIPMESHDITINGIDLGPGSTNVSEVVNPGQTVNIPVQQTVETASFSQLASSIISNGGNLDVQITGEAHFSLLGIPLSVQFQKSEQISLVQEIEQHVEALVSGQSSSQSSNQYNSNPPSSGGVIVNGEYNVSPGTYYSIPFTLSSAATITGSFSATATLGNNIIVYVFDQANFAAYENGQASQVYYNSGKVATGSIDLQLAAGTYYIVLDNTYSTISTKDVTIQVSAA